MKEGTIIVAIGARCAATIDGSKGVKGVARKLGELHAGKQHEEEAKERWSGGHCVGYKHACEPPSTDKSDSVATRANADDGALAEFVAA